MSSGTKRHIIIALILSLVAIGGFGYMFHEISVQGSTLGAQVSALKEEQAQEATFIRLQKIAEDSETDREELSSYFLTRESDSIDFLNLVEGIAPTAGVTLKTSNLETIVDKSDSSSWIEVSFSFTGSRIAVHNFIEILENVPYVSRLMSIDISSRSNTNWQADVVMRVRILGYDE